MDLPLDAVRRSRPLTLLEIDLARGLADASPEDPVAAVRRRRVPLLGDVVDGLRRAAADDEVAGVVLLVGSGPSSVAQAEELGRALEELGDRGKATVAFAESFGEMAPGTMSYYLASHCDTVWLQPSGAVSLTGVTLDVAFLRGLLDKIGATPMVGQRHEYKSAADTLLRGELTEPNREMTQRLADSVVEQVVATVARRRRLSTADVVTAMAAAPLPAAAAEARGLVDRLGYRDEVYTDLRSRLGRAGDLRLLFAHRYARKQASRPLEQARSRRRRVVALVPVRGGIVSGRSRSNGLLGAVAGSDTVGSTLLAQREDDDVAAVVLHVDSPGGSYVASDAIRRAVLAVRETGRPVVASMGRLAASGGYFVSMPADRIVALPGTLTGSIGVLAGKLVIHETLARLGVNRETVGAGPRAGMHSSNLPYDSDQWQRLQEWLDAVYEDFTRKAAADRGMPVEQLEPLARGRVWTGADARARGLVDELGGLEHAVGVACQRAGLHRDQVHVRRPRASLRDRVRPAQSTAAPAASVLPDALATGGQLARLLEDVRGTGVLSLPWDLRLR